MATTDIDRLRTVGPRKAKNVTFNGCWGPEADKHQAGCSPSTPMCRYRRPAPCNCPALHFPHRAGSGRCGKGSAHLYKAPVPTPIGGVTPSGHRMSEAAWLRARSAVAAMVLPAITQTGIFAGEPPILTTEMLAAAAALLTGEVAVSDVSPQFWRPSNGYAHGRTVLCHIADLVADLVAEHSGDASGTMLSPDAVSRVRAMLACDDAGVPAIHVSVAPVSDAPAPF